MKTTKLVAAVAIAVFAFSNLADAQKNKLRPVEVDAAHLYFSNPSLSPTVGSNYSIVMGLGTENPIDGSGSGFFFGIAADPDTGVVNDGVMDDQVDVVGVDLSDVFGNPAGNPVNATECLESLGTDVMTGRFILRLTVANTSTASAAEWDTLDMDLLDPLDFDLDGDFMEPDGFFDTGDGVLDAPFPLDPVGLVFLIDIDGDGDPMNDPPTPAVAQGFFLGFPAGMGTNIPFDAGAGQIDVNLALWELLNFNDELADIDLDGAADGPFDLTAFEVFNPLLGGGWMGDLGVGFTIDGDIRSTQETVGGSVKTTQLVVEYLSDVEAEFCFDDSGFLCGDVNLDGAVTLLDVAPFVVLVQTGVFQAEADINGDGSVDLLDVAPFVVKIQGG